MMGVGWGRAVSRSYSFAMPIRSIRSAFVAALCAVVLLAAPAHAHGHLVRSRPAAHDTLKTAPRVLTLEFNEPPELSMSSVRLLDSLHHEVRLAPVHADAGSAKVLIAGIVGALGAGRYTVMWQIAGRDGHPTHGQYDFVVAGDSAGAAPLAPPPASVVDTA